MKPLDVNVAHLTTAHWVWDNRIFNKECRSLVKGGYCVTLIASHSRDETVEGVRILAIKTRRTRIRRMILSSFELFKRAVAIRADIYHFHDIELIPVGILLRAMGKAVVYDVHEDYTTSIRQKTYLKSWLGALLSWSICRFEEWASQFFEVVVAEKYYLKRFPRGTLVLNFPNDTPSEELVSRILRAPLHKPHRLIYTGGVTADRGAFIHAGIVRDLPDIEVHFYGICQPDVAIEIRNCAGESKNRIKIVGEGAFVPYSRIRAAYEEGGWLAGLAVFPDTPHYREKELTKMYEYMSYGLPILCSDFPVWKVLVEDNGCGICVSPDSLSQLCDAVKKLCQIELRRSMIEKGTVAARQRYTWSRQYSNMEKLYERIIDKMRR